MSDNVEIPALERIIFFPGQQLTAADLTELQDYNRELRWLHNRSLHSWGIAKGFGVTGGRGSRAVKIEPGYAVDRLGREIILGESISLPVPAIAEATGGKEAVYYLTASYLEDSDQTVAERQSGVCLPDGTVRLRDEPRISWHKPDQLTEGVELILAKAWIKNCQLSRPLCLAARRNARPSAQPYIASGQTGSDATDWKLWQIGGQALGVEVQVDTSQARFRATPRYVAHVTGDRYLGDAPGPLIAVGYPATVEGTPEQFKLQVLLPAIASGQIAINPPSLRSQQAPGIVKKLGWQVVWMGIEG